LFPAGGKPEVVRVDATWNSAYDRAISHFLDVVLNGEALRATPQDGRENVRVVLAAYESARGGGTVMM